MPYQDKKKQKKFMARQYRTKYATDLAFKNAEAKRKSDWYQKNRERLIAKVLENRAKKVKGAL